MKKWLESAHTHSHTPALLMFSTSWLCYALSMSALCDYGVPPSQSTLAVETDTNTHILQRTFSMLLQLTFPSWCVCMSVCVIPLSSGVLYTLDLLQLQNVRNRAHKYLYRCSCKRVTYAIIGQQLRW